MKKQSQWLIVLLLGASWACAPNVTAEESIEAALPPEAMMSQPLLQFESYSVSGRRIQYVEGGNRLGRLVLFIHGSPGSWSNFRQHLADPTLQQRAHLISVDRPGFGGSGAGREEPSLQVQAQQLSPLLEKGSNQGGAILVGHSLGGSVIARMAMDYPSLVGGLVMVAPALAPEYENPRWYNRLASLAVIRLILPRSLDTSNREILPLKAELAKMAPLWPRVTAPTVIIQGLKDRLVDPANIDFAERVLSNARVFPQRVKEAGHFILWERPQLIVDAVLQLLDQPANHEGKPGPG